ncbi:MAG TPA: GspH/FimT family pseudopilin [Stellaceae bacterium]|nr:GspH/FimT family pseudopilin [Stellaceae bacterium]
MARERGFTLIELVVVLAILALATALVTPLLSRGRDRAEFDATVREVAAALRETRSLAMTRDRSEALLVDVAHGVLRWGGRPADHRVPRSIRLALLTTAGERLDEESGDIRFFPDGSSTGGHVTLMQGERRRDVFVDWLSGRISVGDATAPPAR